MKTLQHYLLSIAILGWLGMSGHVVGQTIGDTLFQDDFADRDSKGWDRFGGKWTTLGELTVNAGDGYKIVVSGGNYTDFVYAADVKITSTDGEAGLIFRVTNPGVGATAWQGYYLQINAGADTVTLGKIGANGWAQLGVRYLPLDLNSWYRLQVKAAGNHLLCYVFTNPNEPAPPYPVFDAVDAELPSGTVGLRTWFSDATFDNISVMAYTPPVLAASYTNPIKPLTGDPGVLYHNGTYYLYATQTASPSSGFKVFTSTDLVNWSDDGWALRDEDSWGNKDFWAPEVIERNGTFYMYYTVQERIAVAMSDSPLGPFKQRLQEPIAPTSLRIDPHVFQDDDGKCYLYYVAFNHGNEIWAAELNPDMTTIKEDTRQRMIAPSQEWEKHLGNINEAPFVVKHKGIYYLTYSGSHVASPHYGVGYATATHPLGPWTKYLYNPILKSTSYVHGPGHHCLTTSPDGQQMVIVYHVHYDVNTPNPLKRKLAIDRIRFTPQAHDPDILHVWGPTSAPQPKIVQ